MDSNQWDKLKKDRARAKKLMQQAGVPEILLQLRWGSLGKTQRKKIEQVAKGKGWFEEKEEVVTSKGTENKAPKHRKAALKAQGEGAINEPIKTESEDARSPSRDKEYAITFLNNNPVPLSDIEYYRGRGLNRHDPHGIPDAIWHEAWKKVGGDGEIMVLDSTGGVYDKSYSVDDVVVNRKYVKEKKEETLESTAKQAGIDLTGLVADEEYHKLRMAEGALKGKTAFRCPECNRGLSLHKSGKLVCRAHGTPTKIDKAIDLRKIGKDKETTEWAKNEYEGWLAEAKTEGYPTVGAYVNSMEDNRKDSYKEYARLGTGLEKIFNPDASKKEPPLITDPQRKSYDPAFEKSEDERMKEEKERERDIGIIEAEETIGATGHDSITGEHYPDQNEYSQSPEEEEFSDLLAEAILIGAITSIEEKYEWQRLFNHNYPRNTDSATKELQELIEAHEKKRKPKSKRASEALITLYPEEHYFGTEVTVVTEDGVVDYTGKILRLLNGGTLAEVRPSGDSFKGSSFRVPIEQVYVNKVVENYKEPSKAEPEQKTTPKIAISKTDSHSVYLVGDVKERSFVALANIVVTEDGRILELPGMDYMKGRDYPSENFNFTTVKEYLIDLKAKKEEVKRKQQEEKEAYEKKEAEIKERLSKPPSGYFIHKQDEQGDPLLESVMEKVYPFEYQGIDLFAFKDTKGWNKKTSWNISERRTGLFVAGGRTKAEAIQKAREWVDKKSASEIKRQIKAALGKMGVTMAGRTE